MMLRYLWWRRSNTKPWHPCGRCRRDKHCWSRRSVGDPVCEIGGGSGGEVGGVVR